MAIQTQILVDGPRNLIVKVTAELTADLVATEVVTPLTSYLVTGAGGNAPPLVRLNHIDYSISDALEVTPSWGNAAGPILAMLPLYGRGRMSFDDFSGLRNNAAGTDGSIWVSTTGYTSGTLIFSLIFELIKEGLQYSGGAL